MMRRTMNLRLQRGVLQQEWVDEDPRDEGGIRFEWRDVPVVDTPAVTSNSRKDAT